MNNRLPVILTVGLLFGVILSLIKVTDLTTAGILIYGVTGLGVVLYGIKFLRHDIVKGLIISFSGLICCIGIASAFFQWPYAIELRLIMTLSLLGFFFLLLKRKLTRPEVVLLLIINLDLVIKIAQVFN